MEGVRDAGGGYFDGFGVFRRECTVFEGGIEVVNYGEGESLFGV